MPSETDAPAYYRRLKPFQRELMDALTGFGPEGASRAEIDALMERSIGSGSYETLQVTLLEDRGAGVKLKKHIDTNKWAVVEKR